MGIKEFKGREKTTKVIEVQLNKEKYLLLSIIIDIVSIQ